MTAQVQLPGQLRPVTCLCENDLIEVGERWLVDYEGKSLLGIVVRIPLDLERDGSYRAPARMIRKASQADEEREAFADSRRVEWLSYARRRAEALNLPMKFVRCEPSSGGKRVVLLFTADERVDFRELVRELAREFRARVELKQIGARDAAALQGGIGHCGQQLCCSRFLTGFAPISMKLAKQQGLPLNPTKISGQCGRLMCCLRYEVGDAGVTHGEGCQGGCASKRDNQGPRRGPTPSANQSDDSPSAP